jgi:hypothetical protein
MNLNLKVTFKDKMVKVKIYNKIKVKELLNMLRHELRIPQENEIFLMNDQGRLNDCDELTEKDLKKLKENWILVEDTDYEQQGKNETEKKRELTGLDQNRIIMNRSSSNINISNVDNRDHRDNKTLSNISMAEMIKLCTGAETLLKQSKIKKKIKRPGYEILNFLMHRGHHHDEDDEDQESSYDMEFDDSESDEFSNFHHDHEHQFEPIINRHPGELNSNESLGIQNVGGSSIQSEGRQAGSSMNPINVQNSGNLIPSMNNSSNLIHNYSSNQNPREQQDPFRVFRQPAPRIINYDQILLTELMEMGFPLNNSRIALRASRNNMEIAVHYLLNAPDNFFAENEELAVENNIQPVALNPQPNINPPQSNLNNADSSINIQNQNQNIENQAGALNSNMRDRIHSEFHRHVLDAIPLLVPRLYERLLRSDISHLLFQGDGRSNIQNNSSIPREEVREQPPIEQAREIQSNQQNHIDRPPLVEVSFSQVESISENFSQAEVIQPNIQDLPSYDIVQSVYSEPISEVHAHDHQEVIRIDLPMDTNMLSEIQGKIKKLKILIF